MSVQSKWLIIFIGNNNTGKTTIQRTLVELINGRSYTRLTSNKLHDVTNKQFIRKCRAVFIAGRSYQEFSGYKSVADYFKRAFDPKSDEANIAVMSSHLVANDIQEMIREGHRRCYNVCGLFFSNSIQQSAKKNAAISELPWDERWTADNNLTARINSQSRQLREVSETIVQMLVERQRSN